ncbi:girdin-like [Seriola dumerili]|uniref:girdin-like n=1 Tax=Seriola dumerili TaxID=41447 RepID=UPI000BBEBCFA|nr:girdin-like [Seriola dumerili]
MESGVFLPSLDQFMLSPLVTWVKTFVPNDGGMHLDFSELLDGVFLNDIMTQINPSATPKGANKVSRDPSQRMQNLNVLVQQIKTYYLDNLRQLIMIPLPNVLLLGRTPYCEQSLEEIKKLLLLLLGCAVQCEKKEEYIERIQTLDFDTKAAIAAHIQELTHSQENVLDLQWLESSEMNPDEVEASARNMATHLRHLLDQRDNHLETIAELMQEKEGVVSLLNSPSSPQSGSYSPSIQQQQQTGSQQHLAVELADSKAKIRRLRQELEEKSEQMLDCRHELENMEAELKRIQQENSQLLVDARAARTYRDELDALRERAIKADKLESEVGRYREQLHKMEFYKTKVEELKEDNRVLQETKEVLEDQLEGWRARSDKVHQLEKHGLMLKAQIHDMEQEREADRRRVEELQEENLTLCLAQRRSMEESQLLGWELEQLSKTTENTQGPQTLSEEVSERTRSRMLKLEKENQSLLSTIEELRAVSISNSTQPKHSHHHERESVCQVVSSINNWTSSTGEPSGLQTSCSNTENHSNAFPLSTVPQQMLNGDLNSHRRLHTEEPKGVQSEILLTDNPDLHIQEKGQLEDGDKSEHLKELMSDLEVLENAHNRLHCFVGSCDHSPGSNSIFTGLPARSSYASKHTHRLEAKCKALDTVNQHLQASLDNSDRKIQRLEAEVQELEAENQSLQATLEELRIAARRLEQLETEKQSLEQETTALERDKRQLEKENRRLRQQAEIQDANLDSSNVCMAGLEREMRFLVKEVEGLRETAERVKGLERDNRELSKQAAIDQRTLATLREELVSEKLKMQQRDNELERLTHELEMKVLSQESAQQAEQETPDDSRFKMLESELESSLKKSLQIKEDKMAALEARLQESSTLNQQLRQNLKTVKLSYEALQQRQEEERTASSPTPPTETGKAMSEWLRESQEATKELLKLKDRLIEVERNNATLEAERQAMQAQLKQLESQSDSQQAQILALQRQAASLQENNTALQTHNANLQVEKSTLNSQSASLMAQNAQLQQQQTGTESERDSALREREDLRSVHEQLLRDHERLAALHERQAMEYEALMGKHGCLKNAHRTLELEHRTLQDRYNSLLQQRAKLDDLEKALREEQMRMALEKEQHKTTAAECCRLRDEKDWLNQTYHQLLNDNETLTADHKQLKSQLNEAKLEHTWLEADFSKLKKEFQQLDITSTKLNNQCELLSQLKGNLEEENRHLLSQIETLMLQNRTLLEQTMESKDLFHLEERQYIDKLNDLRRQKEKLEEKIMDQYKFYEPLPLHKRGNWITLKLKKLMKSSSREHGPERSSTPKHSGVTDPHLSSHDNGSFLSSDGSGGSASTSAGDAISPQRNNITTLKMFPRMRNRLKDRDKVKSIFRRSMYSTVVFGQKLDTRGTQGMLIAASVLTSAVIQRCYRRQRGSVGRSVAKAAVPGGGREADDSEIGAGARRFTAVISILLTTLEYPSISGTTCVRSGGGVQELEAENQSLQATLEELSGSAARRLERWNREARAERKRTTSAGERQEAAHREGESTTPASRLKSRMPNFRTELCCMAGLEREMLFSSLKEVEGLRETAEESQRLGEQTTESPPSASKQAASPTRETLATLREVEKSTLNSPRSASLMAQNASVENSRRRGQRNVSGQPLREREDLRQCPREQLFESRAAALCYERIQSSSPTQRAPKLAYDHVWNQTYHQLLNDNETLTADHKVNSEPAELRPAGNHTWLEADFSKLQEGVSAAYITSTKLNNMQTWKRITLKLKKLMKIQQPVSMDRSDPSTPSTQVLLIHTSPLMTTVPFSAQMGSGAQPPPQQVMPSHPSVTIVTLGSLASPLARWADSSEQLEGSEADVEEDRKDALTSSLTTSILSILHLHHLPTPPSGRLHIAATDTTDTTDNVPDVSELWVTDKDSNDNTVPFGYEDNNELQNHALNGIQSRAHSESSGEFSLSLENEPWSNGSSPIQQPPSRRSSSSYQPPSDASTPQHKVKASTMPNTNRQNSDLQSLPKQKDLGLSQDFWLTRGTKSIRRGSQGKVARRSSDSGGTVKIKPGLTGMNSKLSSSKADTTRASACSPITVLYVQGKSSSMSGCLNCFSTPLGKEGRLREPRSPNSLPRASSVISTAEGSSRRSSVNSDCRVNLKTDSLQAQASEDSNNQEETVSKNKQPDADTKNSESEPVPPVKPPRDPAVVVPADRPKSLVQESLCGSSFTFSSVFSNTIFSDSVVTTKTSLDALDNNQSFLCLNPSLVQNCPAESQESSHNTTQTLLNMDNEQSQNAEHAAGLEEKDKPLTIA